MLSTKVIASSISNLTDARYFAAWGVDAVGFDLQSISAMQVNAFKEWISGPRVIGQFSSAQEHSAIQDFSDRLALDYIQLDALAPSDWKFNKPIIQELVFETWKTTSAEIYILKSSDPNFSIDKHLDKLHEICKRAKCYLDLGLGVEDLKYLDTIQAEGIILRGGDEEKVGFKSFDELDDIMEVLAED